MVGVDLSESMLDGAVFARCELAGANLAGTSLELTTFRGCGLPGGTVPAVLGTPEMEAVVEAV